MRYRWPLLSVVPVLVVSLFLAHRAYSLAAHSTERTQQTAADLARLHHQAEEESDREKGLYFRLLSHGDPTRKEVALTFDDGPHPSWTPQLLALLKSLNVHATFFVVGKMVDRYPELARQEVEEGHELANHTFSHPHLKTLKEPEVKKELREGAEAIRRAVGYAPVFFRPPGGQYNTTTLRAAEALHLTTVLWSANSKDFLYPTPAVIEKRLLSGPAPGGILLCHDGIPQTMQMLPDLVRRLRAQGYAFVTVSELASHVRDEGKGMRDER